MQFRFKQTLIIPIFLLASGLSSFAISAQQETREPEAATGLYQQQLVTAQHYMVSAAHPLAVQAGKNILAKGGSAVDAAIATQLMLGLVEPQSSGLGGGAFMLHWQADNQQLTTFDGREKAPAAATEKLFFQYDKVMDWRSAYVGGKSVGVPGVVAMMEKAHQQFGQLAWADLFTETINIAKHGFAVSSRTAEQLAKGWNKGVSEFPESRQYFYPDGQVVKQGELLKNPAYAKTLEIIASKGAAGFYSGEIAAAIAHAVQTASVNSGQLQLSDLANYQPVQREPVCMPYRIYKVCGMAPPSSGGVAILQILGMLEQYNLANIKPNSVEAIHLLSQAAKLAFADRERYMADPDFVSVPISGMLAKDYLTARGKLINAKAAGPKAKAGLPLAAQVLAASQAIELPNTSHLSIVDAKGNAVSMTTSIENVFGSGLMVAGFLLNNQLTDFSLEPVVAGKAVANKVQGNKRPRSSMAPMMVFDQHNKLILVIGSPGGSRIINYVAQTIIAVLDWRMNMLDAIALPKFTHRNDYLALEKDTILQQQQTKLEKMGYKVQIQDLNSGLHGIMLTEQGLQGAADPRREGRVAGN
ncbi:gamma-glutamyltransferase [Rheinheimera sp. MMS21-TC3]|uniref:gamma-glutamyltransferase n=1 Tax=Rheinheimera sp. MMS21-TC3 TaxID=3072790 RepID=UPI0028C4AEC8|nr:gamma-glutamyltransferase [Rheinheimera sp. MMS21-TC3]WNO60744.1 gamma-glutamyltransferase [Rheinheimera sp. MMS21-TC3]